MAIGKWTRENVHPARCAPVKYSIIIAFAFACSFAIPLLLKSLLPPSEAGFPYIAIAASFILNLAGLALALAWLPDDKSFSTGKHMPHFRAWVQNVLVITIACAGLWAVPVHGESARVFATLALLTASQAGLLFALHAALSVVCGINNRAPKMLCALALCVVSTALFWSREPIERLPRTGSNGSLYSGYLADGVMKLGPPMTVAAAWYQESDGARAPRSTSSRRFDLVHSPLTYAVWIGSYQAVANPDILPSGGGSDFYSNHEFTPGIALALLAWAVPLMLLCDILLRHVPLTAAYQKL